MIPAVESRYSGTRRCATHQAAECRSGSGWNTVLVQVRPGLGSVVAMDMRHCDVVAKKRIFLMKPSSRLPRKHRLKEAADARYNGLASLEVGSIHDNIISLFGEGGGVGLPITLVPSILYHLKEIVKLSHQRFCRSYFHGAPFSLSVSGLLTCFTEAGSCGTIRPELPRSHPGNS